MGKEKQPAGSEPEKNCARYDLAENHLNPWEHLAPFCTSQQGQGKGETAGRGQNQWETGANLDEIDCGKTHQ